MINFKVDESKCTNCGLCSSDCPVLIINNKTEFPEIKEGKEENCLQCQHCLAICPQAAISILGKNPENSVLVSAPTADTQELSNLMKTRRSIRKFKKEEIDKDTIYNLVSSATYAPTAKNQNSVKFSVVDSKEKMEKLRAIAYDCVKEAASKNEVSENDQYIANFQKLWETKGLDIVFRNAPHMIITSAPKNAHSPQTDSVIAMTYFELLANSKGIGSVWNGFAHSLFKYVNQDVKSKLGIPEDYMITSILSFGKAAVKYKRGIQNDDKNINIVEL